MFNIYIVARRTAVCKVLKTLFQERTICASVLCKFYITYAKRSFKLTLQNSAKMIKQKYMKVQYLQPQKKKDISPLF